MSKDLEDDDDIFYGGGKPKQAEEEDEHIDRYEKEPAYSDDYDSFLKDSYQYILIISGLIAIDKGLMV